MVRGDNLILVQEDGSIIVILDGAKYPPTLLLGGIEIPSDSLAFIIKDAPEGVPTAGPSTTQATGDAGPQQVPSSGGEFAEVNPHLGDPFPIGPLLPPTALQFFVPIVKEDEPGFLDETGGLAPVPPPPVNLPVVTATVSVVHDETVGINQSNDVLGSTSIVFDGLPTTVAALFANMASAGAAPGHDPDISSYDNGAIGFAASPDPLVVVGLPSGGGGPITRTFALAIPAEGEPSGVQTTEGTDIFLYAGPDGLILGRVGAEGGSDAADTADPNGVVAFALVADPATGIVYVAQYLSLFHPIAGPAGLIPDAHDDVVSLLANAVQMVVTDTDGITTASTSINVGALVGFEDDGPSVTGVAVDSSVSLDETAAGEAFVAGSITATSDDPIISATRLFGADGAAAANNTVYGLSLTGPTASGLATANGDFPITLVATNPTTIEGQYDGSNVAFTVTIGADGKLTVTQNVALEHLIDGDNSLGEHNDTLDLSGLITATVTITDADGDTASGGAVIGGNITFYDDGPSVTGVAVDSSVSLDETAAGEAFVAGSITATSDDPIISATRLFGADGAAAANNTVYGLSLTGPTASGLATANGDFPITLVATNPTTIEGQYDGSNVAFTVTIGADGKLTVTQNVALEHLIDGDNSLGEHNDTLDLSGLITATVTITDADGDTASGGAVIGGNITFYDDGPSVTGVAVDSSVSLDETAAGEAFVAGSITATSDDPIISATRLFGADGAAAANNTVYGLSLTGPTASGLATANGDFPITLVATNPTTIEGQYDGSNVAFTVTIGADGKLTVTQNVALEHLIDGDNSLGEHNDTLDLSGLITATVTITDADGDTASGGAVIGGNITFYDDGPSVTGVAVDSSVSLDETAAGEAFVAGSITATSDDPIISATRLFGADGAAAANNTVYGLSLTGPTASGLATANGDFPITLVATNPTTIEGQYDGSNVAFTVTIGADGKLTVTQNVALEHLIDGDNSLGEHNDTLDLSGLITATVTITDADGDTASGGAVIGGNITFYDDGPSVTGVAVDSSVSLDETAAGEAFVAGSITATSDDPIISATRLFGADGAAAANNTVYGLSLTGPTASGLATANGDFPITLVATNPTTIEGQYDGSNVAFTVTIGADGKLTVTQNVALEHLIDGDNSLGEHNDTLDLSGLITATVTITDADGDTASGGAVIGGNITFYDDGPSVTGVAVDSSVSLDETAAGEAFVAGSITATSDDPIISATRLFGADGAAAANNTVYGLSLTGPTASGLATANGDFPITLVATNPTTIEGQYDGSNVAFTVTIGADGKLTVTQNVALEHLIDGDNSLGEHNDTLDLSGLITATVTITDADGDTASGGAVIGGNITFYDDGPSVTGVAVDSSVSLDETAAGEAFVAGSITATSDDPIISATRLFGADGAAAANNTVYGLSLTGPTASGLATANGDFPITLVATNPTTIEGQYDGSNVAFTVTIGADGKLTVTQNVALEHLIDGDNSLGEHNDTLDLSGLITATVTITDADGDTASGGAVIGGNITFYDDGPSVTGVAVDSSVSLDETAAGEAFVAGSITATSDDPIISATRLFGADGAAAANNTVYGLSLTGPTASGLATANGDFPITLVATNPTTIEGQYDGSNVAFTVTIGADGKLTVTQNVALEHLIDGDNSLGEHNDTLDLSGLITATVTITDADGDTASGGAVIGGNITFYDDGPSVQAGAHINAVVDEDGLAGANLDAGRPGEVAGTDSATASGGPAALNALVNFGADGAHPTEAFSLKIQSLPVNSNFNSKGESILIVSDGTTLHGYVETGDAVGFSSADREVFTFTVGSDGSYTFTLKDQIDHPALDGGLGDNAENFLGTPLDLSGYIVAKDGDGDTVPLGTGTFTVNVQDDIPVVPAGTPQVLNFDGFNLALNVSNSLSDEEALTALNPIYGGFNWVNTGIHDPADGSGYVPSSGNQLAFLAPNGGLYYGNAADPMKIISIGGVDFSALSANFSTPTSGGVIVTVNAYNNGVFVATETFVVGNGGLTPHAFSSAFGTIDELWIDANGFLGLDDFTFISHQSVTADEDDLSGPIPGNHDLAPGDSAQANLTGMLSFIVGADEPATVDFASMTGEVKDVLDDPVTSGGDPLFYSWIGNTLYASTDATNDTTAVATAVFKIEITNAQTGTYEFTLLGPIDHPLHDNPQTATVETAYEDNIDVNLVYSVTDRDGDTVTGTLTVSIDDDVPIANKIINFDEFVLAENGETPLDIASHGFTLDDVGVYNPPPGAPGYASYSQQNLGFVIGGNDAVVTQTNGENFSFIGAWFSSATVPGLHIVVTGYDNGLLVASQEIVVQLGGPTFVDFSSFAGFGNIDELNFAAPGSFGMDDFTYNSVIIVADEDNISGGLGDTAPGDDAQANLTGVLDFSPGADGATVGFSGISGTAVLDDKGNPVTSGGAANALTFAWIGNVLYGTTAVDPGDATDLNSAFKIAVDPVSGQYVFDLLKPLDHPGHDDPSTSGATETAYEDNLNIKLTYTVTDGDGDTANGVIWVSIDDDTPTAGFTLTNASVTHDETTGQQGAPAQDQAGELPIATASGAGTLLGWAQGAGSVVATDTSLGGADGKASVTYALTQAGGTAFNGQDSGLLATGTSAHIFLYTEGALVVGREGSGATPNPAGAVAFSLGLGPGNQLVLAQYEAIKHPATTDPNDAQSITPSSLVHVTQTVTDGDGDVSTATSDTAITVEFQDDGPSAAGYQPSESPAGFTFNPMNGHFYMFVPDNNTIFSWQRLKSAAQSLGGYLATITSQQENDFVLPLMGAGSGAWLGGRSPDVDGNWYWATGPEAGTQFWTGGVGGSPFGGQYANWSLGEPSTNNPTVNGVPIPENSLHFAPPLFGLNPTQWNDLNDADNYPGGENFVTGYIVEIGGRASDPFANLLIQLDDDDVVGFNGIAGGVGDDPSPFNVRAPCSTITAPTDRARCCLPACMGSMLWGAALASRASSPTR